jgi:hypothetical protein
MDDPVKELGEALLELLDQFIYGGWQLFILILLVKVERHILKM